MINMLETGVQVSQVIICVKERRGNGKSITSPTRVITEVCELDGSLIADKDPCYTTPESVVDFLKYIRKDLKHIELTDQFIEDAVYRYFIRHDD